MPDKVTIGYSARPHSPADTPSLFLAPCPVDVPDSGRLACELMTAAEERHILDLIDFFMMNLHEFISPQIFTWQNSDLTPIMALDFKSMLTEWALFALAIRRFIEETSASTIIVEETADRPWLYELVRFIAPAQCKINTKSAPLKNRLGRLLAPRITRRRGLPATGHELPDKVDYLVLLQNAYTDLSNLAPVIDALQKNNAIVLATDPEALAACQARDYRFCAPGDFGQPDRTEERLFCRMLENDLTTLPLPNDWLVHSDTRLPLRDLFLRYFPYLPHAYLFQMHRFYKYAERALHKLKPRLIILAQDAMRAGSAICAAAKKMHIPTLCLQHGVTGASDHGFLPIHATKLATWGQYSTGFLIAHGGDPECISPAGCTYIQPLIEEYLAGKPPALPERIMTLFTNPSGMAHHREMIEAFAEARRSFPEYAFRIKIHPAERDYTYRKFMQDTGIEMWESKDTPTIIRKSALVVIFSSGVGLDAMLLRRPVLTLNFTGGRDNLGVGEFGAAAYVTNRALLVEQMASAIDNAQSEMMKARNREFLKLYFCNIENDAVARILSLGEDMVSAFARS